MSDDNQTPLAQSQRQATGLAASPCWAPSSYICLGRIFKARELEISPCELAQIRRFVETHHYSHNLNGVKISHCFRVEFGGKLVGGVIFGSLSTTAWKRFADSEEKVMELRRLVLLNEAGRNSESRVIGWCLRWLKKHAPAIEIVVSYADPAHGHSGVIYRASNFQHVGMSAADKGFRDPETGKTYHSRALRTKYNGDFKPFLKRLRAKHEAGLLEVVELPGKHCYTYAMKKKRKAPLSLPNVEISHASSASEQGQLLRDS